MCGAYVYELDYEPDYSVRSEVSLGGQREYFADPLRSFYVTVPVVIRYLALLEASTLWSKTTK